MSEKGTKTRNKLVRMSKVLSLAFVIFLQIYWYKNKIRRKPKEEWDIHWGKEIDLFALKMEMNDMIQILSIQVPTRFAFLGRSFFTIEGIIRCNSNRIFHK
jgi:hypothetical protein